MSVFRTMYLTILQLVWTLVSPKRALTGKGEVVVSGDVAYNPLALAGGRTGAHCTACLIWQYPALTLGIGLF